MENHIYPTRSFIKFSARSQLISNLTGQVFTTYIQRQGLSATTDLISPESPDSWSETSDAEQTGAGNDASSDAMNPSHIDEELDESLFRDITSTTFHPDQHPELYQPCESLERAAEIESQIAAEIVETYQRIRVQQNHPVVQTLNALL
jgi:hypothetical protein